MKMQFRKWNLSRSKQYYRKQYPFDILYILRYVTEIFIK